MDTPPLKRNTKRISPTITYYTFLETPVGRLMIAGASEVVMLINFPTGSQALQPRLEWRRDDAMFGDAKRQLTGYFDGTRTDFTTAVAMDGTDFQKGCWTALRQVPFGGGLETKLKLLAMENPAAYGDGTQGDLFGSA
tara:strand:+ start:587 stop:1000 length:414 start_codon:yes stop_codon:yes gene_type:complete